MVARVVVVEDERSVRQFVTDVLVERGYEVHGFGRVADASRAVREGELDLLLADVDLPDGCGLDLVGILAANERRRVPAIIMSGCCAEADYGRGFAAGAVDYLAKPFTANELLARCALRIARTKTSSSAATHRRDSQFGSGRFHVVRELGRGGFGIVFLARDAGRHGELVALKVLNHEASSSSEAKLRFIRETLALARVEHPGVVKVRDVGETDGRIHYSMEYIDGPSLHEYVCDHGPLPEASAQLLALRLLQTLGAIEGAGIIHRDVKPPNVILRGSRIDDPVLVDFGLARGESDLSVTKAGSLTGTIPYMPPEVVHGGTADGRGDLFSLGLTLRFALTGQDVFPDADPVELVNAMGRGEFPPLPVSVSEPFGVLLRWLTKRERDARPATARAALRVLDAIVKARGAVAPALARRANTPPPRATQLLTESEGDRILGVG
jgi:CheY-like chemotaxis protein/predicted Ser/Thr protein kinase